MTQKYIEEKEREFEEDFDISDERMYGRNPVEDMENRDKFKSFLRSSLLGYAKMVKLEADKLKSDGKIVLNGEVEDRPREFRDFTATTAYNKGIDDVVSLLTDQSNN